MATSGMNMMVMMRERMKRCRWCAALPITFGAVLFVLGYYLGAEAVRALWLIFTVLWFSWGSSLLVMARDVFR